MEFNLEDSFRGVLNKLSDWADALILSLPNFILAILVFGLFIIAAKYLGKILNKILAFRVQQDSIREISVKIIKVLVIAIGFFVALGLLNLDTLLASVLAGAGVVGLAIGLALQGTLNNTFSGILLSFLPELHIGDWIESKEYAGRVVEINLRSIIIKEADNNQVIIPNSQVIDSPFRNFSRTPRSRVSISCGVAYNSNLEKVKQLAIDAIASVFPQESQEEVEFMYNEFGGSSINFILRFWCEATSQKEILMAQSDAIIALKKAFDQNNINIPFPIRTVEFSNKLITGDQE